MITDRAAVFVAFKYALEALAAEYAIASAPTETARVEHVKEQLLGPDKISSSHRLVNDLFVTVCQDLRLKGWEMRQEFFEESSSESFEKSK